MQTIKDKLYGIISDTGALLDEEPSGNNFIKYIWKRCRYHAGLDKDFISAHFYLRLYAQNNDIEINGNKMKDYDELIKLILSDLGYTYIEGKYKFFEIF